MMNVEKVLKDIKIIKDNNYIGIEDFLEKYHLVTPEAIVDFQLQVGNYANKYVKRRLSITFLDVYPYSREDLKKARYSNPELIVLNKIRVIEKYREDNDKIQEFANNKKKPISNEDIKYFLDNQDKLSIDDIAIHLKRTRSSILNLRKACRKILKPLKD